MMEKPKGSLSSLAEGPRELYHFLPWRALFLHRPLTRVWYLVLLRRIVMRGRFVIGGILCACTIALAACGADPASRWVLLSSDSDGHPTFIDAESIHLRDGGVAVYTRVVGDPSEDSRVQVVQGLDCENLRWALLSLDESLLDSIAEGELAPEEWPLLALNPANRALLGEVCEGFSPNRWIRVLKENSDEIGSLREVWVDLETLDGPEQDTVWFEGVDSVFSGEVFRAWTRWHPVSADSGYLMLHTAVSCDQSAVRYLDKSSYSREGDVISQVTTPEFWMSIIPESFEAMVYQTVCELGSFFDPEPTR